MLYQQLQQVTIPLLSSRGIGVFSASCRWGGRGAYDNYGNLLLVFPTVLVKCPHLLGGSLEWFIGRAISAALGAAELVWKNKELVNWVCYFMETNSIFQRMKTQGTCVCDRL